MRSTLDLSDELFADAKIKAVKEGISLNKLFTRALEHELYGKSAPKRSGTPLWKQLQHKGSASILSSDESGFDD